MRSVALLFGVVIAGALLVRNHSAEAQSAASRVIDRTLVCPVTPGGIQEIDVSAASGTRLFGDPSKWKFRPYVSFGDPRSRTPSRPHVGAHAVAGWPPESEHGSSNPDSLAYSARCRSTKTKVPLTTATLAGGVASPVGDRYDCVVPSTVLVRIKAVFRDPTSIRRVRSRQTQFVDQFVARGAVREVTLAIGTSGGKRIALATAHESGRARLFVGNGCEPSG